MGRLLMSYKQFYQTSHGNRLHCHRQCLRLRQDPIAASPKLSAQGNIQAAPRTRMKDRRARAGLIEISERLQHPRERAIPRYENSSLISRMKDKVTIIAPRPTPAHDTESKRATMSSTRPLSPLTSERAITRLLIS
jgi:hypothetical protein